MLWLIGLGLYDEKDVSLKGIKAAKRCAKVFAELYTSPWRGNVKKLEKLIRKKIHILSREEIEERDVVLAAARAQDVALFVPGDPLVATTHAEIVKRAKEQGIQVKIIHSSSIAAALAETGLHSYKFGPLVSLPAPAPNFAPTSPYEKLAANKRAGLHTAVLLDIGLTAKDGIELLLELERKLRKGIFTPATQIVVAARLGAPDCYIAYGKVADLLKEDFGLPPHVLIVPGSLHFTEKEFLKLL